MRRSSDGSPIHDVQATWVGYALIFVVPFVAALAAGPWAALALPVAVLIALPAGYGSEGAEIPIWFVMMFVSLIAFPVIVVGWAARWLVTRYASR
jgi:hypothetical protein